MDHALQGEGQVIGIVGEAGVGKSRLCHEFTERMRAEGAPVYHVAGQAHAKLRSADAAARSSCASYFDITEHDPDRRRARADRRQAALLDQSFAEDLPLMFDFLAVPDPQRRPPRMDPEARQRQLLGAAEAPDPRRAARVSPASSSSRTCTGSTRRARSSSPTTSRRSRGRAASSCSTSARVPGAAGCRRSYYRQIALVPLGAEAIDATARRPARLRPLARRALAS